MCGGSEAVERKSERMDTAYSPERMGTPRNVRFTDIMGTILFQAIPGLRRGIVL